jgi:hypothetical protein
VSEIPGNTPPSTHAAPRDPVGRWLPGGPSPNPAGRSPKVREVEIHEASARGCPADQWEHVVAKLVELALEGDVPAARLLAQVRGAIGTDNPTSHAEVGESLAHVLERPGAAEKIAKLMDEVFSTPKSEAG